MAYNFDLFKQSDYLIESVLLEKSSPSIERLNILLANLVKAQYNFRVLHWNATTVDFDAIHGIMQSYYDQIEKDIDDVAEILMICGGYPKAFSEIASMKFHTVNCNEKYDKFKIFEETDKILSELIDSLENVESGLSEELADVLRQMRYYYKKEKDYKNNNRLNNK